MYVPDEGVGAVLAGQALLRVCMDPVAADLLVAPNVQQEVTGAEFIKLETTLVENGDSQIKKLEVDCSESQGIVNNLDVIPSGEQGSDRAQQCGSRQSWWHFDKYSNTRMETCDV